MKIKNNAFSIIFFLVIMIVICNGKEKIQPISYLPNPQNGYGSAPDQLAQPDDVEILKNGSMIITDVDNNRIQIFNYNGKLQKSIDSKTLGLKNIEIIPTGISSDDEGCIYITLEGVGMIARFLPDMSFDQFIGSQGKISADEYYLDQNVNLLIKPQGIIVSGNGDVFVIDMAKKIFKKNGVRNFGFKKFKKTIIKNRVKYVYDREFAASQEITKIMRKSEGMAISNKMNLLFVAEEKPSKSQFGNKEKKRYIAVFDLETGKFLNRLIGVKMENGEIIDGNHYESIEGLSVLGDNIYAVDEKQGRVYCYNIHSGKLLGYFGKKAYYYCDDESDCVLEGVNYNEQSIIAGKAMPHLLNDWQKNEMASPDGVCAIELDNGKKILAVVDQWNSRILYYDLEKWLKLLK